jgi:hypothetical protein
VACIQKILPSDFKSWDLATDDGWTVAHLAALCDCLPPDFERWELTNNEGMSVKDMLDNELKKDLLPKISKYIFSFEV